MNNGRPGQAGHGRDQPRLRFVIFAAHASIANSPVHCHLDQIVRRLPASDIAQHKPYVAQSLL
jgi:hypothetical protein